MARAAATPPVDPAPTIARSIFVRSTASHANPAFDPQRTLRAMKSNRRLAWIPSRGVACSRSRRSLRVHRTHSSLVRVHGVELVLAMVPYCCTRLLQTCWHRQRRVSITFVVIAFAWLVFPNAPYVLTDVIHLGGDALWLARLAARDGVRGNVVARRARRSRWWTTCSCAICRIVHGAPSSSRYVLAQRSRRVSLGRFFRSWDVIRARTARNVAVNQLIRRGAAQPHAFALFFRGPPPRIVRHVPGAGALRIWRGIFRGDSIR